MITFAIDGLLRQVLVGRLECGDDVFYGLIILVELIDQ